MALKSKKTQTKNSESKVKHIGLVKNDAYLAPYEEAIKGRHDHALWKLNSLTNNGKTKLTDLPMDISIMVCTKQSADGCSANGHLMLLQYIL